MTGWKLGKSRIGSWENDGLGNIINDYNVTDSHDAMYAGLSSYAYRREDGVYVVPITALRNRGRPIRCFGARVAAGSSL